MSKITDAVKEYSSAYSKLKTTIDEALDEAFREFFHNHPEFRTIEWRQYTPSFNDGDPCTLIVADIYHTFQPEFYDEEYRERIEDFDYEVGDLDDIPDPIYAPSDWDRQYAVKYNNESSKREIAEFDALPLEKRQFNERLNKAIAELRSDISMIPNDIMDDIFGDNKAIRITKDGRQIEEYWCGY